MDLFNKFMDLLFRKGGSLAPREPPGYGPDYVFNKIHHTMQTEAWAFAIVVYNMYAVARSYE